MINLATKICNKHLTKILLTSVFLSLFTLETVKADNPPQENPLIAQQISTTHKPPVSPQEIQAMVTELQALIYRVKSTLITAESRQIEEKSLSAIAQKLLKNRDYLANNTKTTLPYGNNRAYEAIAFAEQVVREFPNLAQQDYYQARRMWLDARRKLWDRYPIDRNFATAETRAIWLDRGTIVKAKSKQDLVPLFDRMAEAGINTVFFETVNSSYTIYPSRIAPEQNPMTRGWDPLQASIELAHERGMELHAWTWIFAAANQGHNRLLRQPENYLGPVISRNPSWVLKDQNGAVFNNTPGFKKAFFDPAHPGVRNYLSALLEEIATKYDVDGIQLDYIRYPFQDNHTRQHFGYTEASSNLFTQTYGIDPKSLTPSSPNWSMWTGFRTQQVNSFVSEISQRLKEKRPELIISAAVFPMDTRQRLKVLQQHWEEWMYSEWVDMIVLMTYALDTGSFESRTESVHSLGGKNASLIIPGIRLLNVPDTETFDQVQLIRNMPSGGFALFAAENFNGTLGKMLQQTQGNISDTPLPIPHRHPFVSVFNRYEALKQEWVFLLSHNLITIDATYLPQWAKDADKLSDSFQALAENPTSANLATAKKDLSNFKVKFDRYLAKHQQKHPHQMQTWVNRLKTLDNLLKYGEKTIASESR